MKVFRIRVRSEVGSFMYETKCENIENELRIRAKGIVDFETVHGVKVVINARCIYEIEEIEVDEFDIWKEI